MVSEEELINENLKANVVIIGGGGSGLAAAVTAAEKGVSDIVVTEKMGHTGGNTAMALGFFACDSPVQRAAMVDCSADYCFKFAMKWAHWKVNPRIVRAYFDKSGDTVRWLQNMGLGFELKTQYPNQLPVWHHPEGFGANVIKVLTKNCEEMGVKLLYNTNTKRILRGENGNITGIVATKEGGGEFNIYAKSVVIATGGFAGNKELLKKYCPEYHEGMSLIGAPLAGDGLLMAAEVGVAIADTVPLLKIGAPVLKGSRRMGGSLGSIIKEPYTIWVNNKGMRFIDETEVFYWDCINGLLMQPDGVTYTLFDDETRRDIEENGPIIKSPVGDNSQKGLLGLSGELKKSAKENEGSIVKIADTWKEIAIWMNVDSQVLTNTIEEYNSCCDRGRDEVFTKDKQYLRPLRKPPFYAVKCGTAYHETTGGIKVNEYMEAIDRKSNVIPGLYVAGVIADDWVSDSYWGVLSGSAFSFALNSGRIAGESVVKYIYAKS